MTHKLKTKCAGCEYRKVCAARGKHGQCFKTKEGKRRYEAFKHMHGCGRK